MLQTNLLTALNLQKNSSKTVQAGRLLKALHYAGLFTFQRGHINILLSFDWTSIKFSDLDRIDVHCSDKKDIIIGIIPELFFSGYREVKLDEVCINIIVLAEKKIS